MGVAYVVRRYPLLSQTFVTNEVREVRRQGVPVSVVALRRGDDHPTTVPDHVVSEIGKSPGDRAAADEYFRTRHPARYRAFERAVDAVGSELGLEGSQTSVAKATSVARVLEAEGVEALHAHFAWEGAAFAWLLSALLNRPWSVTLHANDIFSNQKNLEAKLDAADRLVTVCRYNEQWMREHLGLTRPVLQVVCGVELPPRAEAPEPDVDVLAVGRLVEKKGFDILVRAALLLRDRLPDVRFEIIGDGPLRGELEALVAEHDLGGTVTLLGPQAHTSTVDRISRSRIVCLPCRIAADGDRDSMPVVIKEAMARERPVVASDAVGVPEMVDDTCGRLVAPDRPDLVANALAEILSDHALAARLGAAGRHRIEERFTLRSEVAKLVTMFAESGVKVPGSRSPVGRRARLARAASDAVDRVQGGASVREGVRTARRHVVGRRRQWQRMAEEYRSLGLGAPSLAAITAWGALDSAKQAAGRLRTGAPTMPVGVNFDGPDGLRFAARPQSDDLYTLLPGRERDVHDAILEPLLPGDTFVDVGANVGYYTLRAHRRVAPGGRVVAFEAMPDTAAHLRRQLATNGASDVTVIEAAVTSHASAPVWITMRDREFGMASIHGEGGPRRAVPATTLDEACPDGPVRVMKLDIEGGELEALRGGAGVLARTSRVVVECSRDRDQIADLLEGAGFAVRSLRFTSHVLAEREGA